MGDSTMGLRRKNSRSAGNNNEGAISKVLGGRGLINPTTTSRSSSLYNAGILWPYL